jgi:hypothetical protein
MILEIKFIFIFLINLKRLKLLFKYFFNLFDEKKYLSFETAEVRKFDKT